MPKHSESPSQLLRTYREKRSADRTPEPSGAAAPTAPGRLFVVHKHAARQLHYDLRLEMEGVLRSWAVPKGPSRNPAHKRLAVHVEDHPIEYGDFEGLIPEGNYGAGAVILWDRGSWWPLEDPKQGLAKGKLLFELRGYKLRGRWTLVKIRKGERDWLLIKERDGHVSTDGDGFVQGSVLSGLTVEELKEGATREPEIVAELRRRRAPARAVRGRDVELMLAETRETPFTKDGWLFELKLDGYRVLAAKEGGEGRLLSRNKRDLTRIFPEVANAVGALPYNGIVLDGELVVPDESGRPSFQRLQQRAQLNRAYEVRRASVESPAALYLFDLVAFVGYDLRPLPLRERKRFLQMVVPAAGPLRYSEHFERDGELLYAQVERLGLEGIVGKKADSPYRGGRSPAWLKVRADRVDDLVVVGFTPPKGSRGGFGALHLAWHEGGKLVYAGRVGSGFDQRELREVADRLAESRRDTPACEGPIPAEKGSVWVEPELVVEVRFKEWTDDGLLRQPVFLRFRDDKSPAECVKKGAGSRKPNGPVSGNPIAAASDGTPPGSRLADSRTASRSPPPQVVFSNLDKLFWPEEGYTKGDLVEYYRAISPWLLPYLADRPLVLTRYPDGIAGKSFFQKDAPDFAPEWVRTVRMWSEDSQRELNYFVCEDVSSLLYIANMAAIPLHIWGSRVSSLEKPDWCILDLDPKEAPFEHCVTIAREIKRLCDEIEWPCFVKTSGSSGLHVLLPLGRQCTFEQARTLGGLLARMVAVELPDIATVMRQPSRREGKVYVDYVQNGHGRLLAAPFSVRPLPGAPVSMPLKWTEVGPKLAIGDYTIANAPARMNRLGNDPARPVIELRPDLGAILQRLHERFAARGTAGRKASGGRKPRSAGRRAGSAD
jgi:bifunctional non-homologous end joining protein LigD